MIMTTYRQVFSELRAGIKEVNSGIKNDFKKGYNNAVISRADFRTCLIANKNAFEFAKVAGIQVGLQSTFRLFRLLKVANGNHLSIQASENHVCSPRVTVAPSLYDTMTLSFLTSDAMAVARPTDSGVSVALEDELKPFMLDTQEFIYGDVPVELIQRVFVEALTIK